MLLLQKAIWLCLVVAIVADTPCEKCSSNESHASVETIHLFIAIAHASLLSAGLMKGMALVDSSKSGYLLIFNCVFWVLTLACGDYLAVTMYQNTAMYAFENAVTAMVVFKVLISLKSQIQPDDAVMYLDWICISRFAVRITLANVIYCTFRCIGFEQYKDTEPVQKALSFLLLCNIGACVYSIIVFVYEFTYTSNFLNRTLRTRVVP